jgi:hypothetical protein
VAERQSHGAHAAHQTGHDEDARDRELGIRN